MPKQSDYGIGAFIGDEQRELSRLGRAERQAQRRLRSDMGDRQSDALARQIAMAPVYDKLLHPNMQTDAPSIQKTSSSPSVDSNQALREEIDRQNSKKSTSKKIAEKTDQAWDSAFLDPASYGELILSPKTPVKNPRIAATTDDGKSGLNNFKLSYITQDRKPVLTSASLKDLGNGVIFSGTVDKNHPIKISVLNTSKYRLSLQAVLQPA